MTANEPPCSTGACIQVEITATTVEVRDTKRPDLPPIVYSHAAWHQHVAGPLLDDAARIPTPVGHVSDDEYAWVGFGAGNERVTHWFVAAEWDAFVKQLRDGAYRAVSP